MESNWITIMIVIVIIGLILLCACHSSIKKVQEGGEYVYYYMLGPENSQRKAPLGYLTETEYVGPSGPTSVAQHAKPSRIHSHNKVHTDGRDDRRQTDGRQTDSYLYQDQFYWKPYDWRPFEWKPFWETREHCPQCNTDKKATKQCIGTGFSDYQSCFDNEYNHLLKK